MIDQCTVGIIFGRNMPLKMFTLNDNSRYYKTANFFKRKK